MCGIAGVYASNFGLVERELFESLLLLNVYRGRDSTGVIRINEPKKGQPLLNSKRAVMSSPGFISSKVGSEFIHDVDKAGNKETAKTIGFIGHCRAATKGVVKVANAHPFRFDHVIGVHNGTIKSAFKGSSQFETDSEALYALINDEGIEAALNHIQDSDPAYALAWVDSAEKTLNFVRNKERPLTFTFIYGKTTLLWSSTQKALDFALEMRPHNHARTSWAPDIGKDGYFTLSENHVLSVPLGESSTQASIRKLDVRPPRTRTYATGMNWQTWDEHDYYGNAIEPKPTGQKQPHALLTGGSSDGYGNFRESHSPEDLSSLPWLSDEQKEVQKTSEKGSKGAGKGSDEGTNGGKADVAASVFRANAHRGEPLSQSERNFRLSQGCFCCGTPISHTDVVSVTRARWWNREFFACGDCYENVNGDTDWVAVAIDNEIPDAAMTIGVAVH